MADNAIGKCKCPLCGSLKADARVSARALAYIVCGACNCQVFARSDKSDAEIRALVEPVAPAEPAPAPPAEKEKGLLDSIEEFFS